MRMLINLRLWIVMTAMFIPAGNAQIWAQSAGTIRSRPVSPLSQLERCRELLLTGEYDSCIDLTTKQLKDGSYGEELLRLKAEAQFARGQYRDALETALEGLNRYQSSIRLRWLAMRIAAFSEQPELRNTFAQQIASLVQTAAWRYTDAENLVTLGQFLLAERADAKQVQEAFFQRAKRNNPSQRSPILALADLAIEKRDFALAADLLRPARDQFPGDPDILFALAVAVGESDRKQGGELLQLTLQHNPNHIPAMLLLAENQIDGEQYSAAMELLDRALAVNPWHPEALALKSVTKHLEGDDRASEDLRNKALSKWKTNPLVDHVIGRKLSQKYRFREGSQAQRRALAFDSEHLAAKKQLAQDLLRLGQEAEGWRLADEVYQQDAYDVASYNLVTLRDELAKFRTIDEEGFIIRMDAHEADVYGERVVALLVDARKQLCSKYEVELKNPTLVEIFPKPADFAVRTFGMPAAGGYLGVCFGDVITANSPASQGSQPVNWESVLWHEFAHVVTLNKTHNRMPRWLSEGISVYEERQRNPSWGERMTPTYRQLILKGDFQPIGKLSQAFLQPGGNLLFAYYQSSMAVEYIINTFGLPALVAILNDLGAGMPVNDAIERHTQPLAQLDEEFAQFFRSQALMHGWAVDWSEADLAELSAGPGAADKLIAWAKANPRNYRGLKTCAELLMKMNQPDAARPILEQAISWYPLETGPDSAWMLLARLQREQGETAAEKASLRHLTSIDDDAAAALMRLIELGIAEQDWPAVREDALKLLSIKPLIPIPHSALAKSGEALGQRDEVIAALNSRLHLANPDLADVHYRLAVQLQQQGAIEDAKRHVLQAIEVAPRFRDALTLLLELREP